MFFILSKAGEFFLQASNLLILLGLLGVVLLATRYRRAGTRLAVASVVLLAIAGFSPLGGLLGHALESRFPPWDPARGPPDGIVVLGGSISSALSRDYGEAVLTPDGARVVAIAKLARAYPKARIVFAGGDASLFGRQAPETQFVYPLLDSFGVPRERVLLESKSRNTAENAAFSKALVEPKPGERWLLVTSAQHMPRAVGIFRRIGFPVEAYPVAWRTRARVSLMPGQPMSTGLDKFDRAVHEWIGLIAYWLTGRTSELLPGPATGN